MDNSFKLYEVIIDFNKKSMSPRLFNKKTVYIIAKSIGRAEAYFESMFGDAEEFDKAAIEEVHVIGSEPDGVTIKDSNLFLDLDKD